MRPKSPTAKATHGEPAIQDTKRVTRRQFLAEEKIRIIFDGLRGEGSIAELCRREGIAQSRYRVSLKDFLEAGKRRLAGVTVRAATTDEADLLLTNTANLPKPPDDAHPARGDPLRVVGLFQVHDEPARRRGPARREWHQRQL